MTVEQIFLLYDDKASLQQIALESEQWGVKVQTVETMEQCLSLAHSTSAEMVFALMCQADNVFLHINRLRMDFPAAGVLVVRRDKMAGLERGHLLLAGADACFDQDALPVEVVACVQALRRRGYALQRRLQTVLAEPAKAGPVSQKNRAGAGAAIMGLDGERLDHAYPQGPFGHADPWRAAYCAGSLCRQSPNRGARPSVSTGGGTGGNGPFCGRFDQSLET